ncbi:hypothetical protein [Teichococcus oryzae]|uniref:Uncharacterized protein n=1 Tax=Teichococcus oryzae TaxID=1608942 RepID=A0A5B2TIP8_9PROT|nr:hypothetical protein [Pseudoroseomonas oryzae]KAA2214351.1 hypothetical protein F0Q34_01045 [Pseudoroseomonas oryzae]
MAPRLAPRRLAEDEQRVWIGFGGRADRFWMRLLAPGFRHCFAVLQDARGWTVVEPLSGRLLVARLELEPDYDLPAFYRRADLALLGPFEPGPAMCSALPTMSPFSCVAVCRAVLGREAPFALTPRQLFAALRKQMQNRKKVIDTLAASP